MPFDHVLAMSIGDYVELEEHCNQVIYGEHWDSDLFCDEFGDCVDALPADIVADSSHSDVPDGYKFETFPLTNREWGLVHEAYKTDTSSWCGIRVMDIYAVFNNTFQGSDVVKREIESWRGNVFFPVLICDLFVVTTLASAQREIQMDVNRTHVLVLVVPKGANVHVTCVPAETELDSTAAEWEARDLQADILWWAHNAKIPHAKLYQTQDRATSLAWFPGIEVRAAYFYRTCGVCHDAIATDNVIGCGVSSLVAYSVVQMDDWILPKWVSDLPGASSCDTGLVALLSIQVMIGPWMAK